MLRSLSIKIILGLALVALFFGYIHLYVLLFRQALIVGVSVIPYVSFFLPAFFLPFIFPYVKVGGQSWVRRGILLGLVLWLINMASVVQEIYELIFTFVDVRSILSFILGLPTIFILMGLLASYVFKQNLPAEYTQLRANLRTSPLKILGAFISVILVYVFSMYSIQLALQIPFYLMDGWEPFLNGGLIGLLCPVLSLKFLLGVASITLFYVLFIRKTYLSKLKKMLLIGVSIIIYTSPYLFVVQRILGDYMTDMQLNMTQRFVGIPFMVIALLISFVLVEILPGIVSSDQSQESKSRFKFFVPVLVVLIGLFGFLYHRASNAYTLELIPLDFVDLETIPTTDIFLEEEVKDTSFQIEPGVGDIFELELVEESDL
ncbi:MAG: hypothetical protein KAS07_02820 [Candidatus Pacebacteria bacterium]|nr:hypothetical protein [Candidatus Paceibacterota bacterium]